MRNILVSILITVVTCISFDSSAENAVLVEDAFARESIPGTSISSAYMKIINSSAKGMRLIRATSNVSNRVELHEHTMSDGMMRMRQRESVDIPAGKVVTFQPSGLHLMIFDLKTPLKSGTNIVITLHFDDQTTIDVNYAIKGIKQKKHSHH